MSIATTHTSAAREHFLNVLTAIADSNHHLWWNRGTLWVAFCIVRHGHRQERVRRNGELSLRFRN